MHMKLAVSSVALLIGQTVKLFWMNRMQFVGFHTHRHDSNDAFSVHTHTDTAVIAYHGADVPCVHT